MAAVAVEGVAVDDDSPPDSGSVEVSNKSFAGSKHRAGVSKWSRGRDGTDTQK